MTAAEKMLWTELRRRSCAGYSFRRQQVLLGYIVDFYCHRGKLIVELDGPIHDYQTANDEERTRALTKAGFRVLRFKNEEVYESTDEVVWKIIHKFQE
jgi:very-short-patch-repair endonuclease